MTDEEVMIEVLKRLMAHSWSCVIYEEYPSGNANLVLDGNADVNPEEQAAVKRFVEAHRAD